jgi:hypothetical protein
VYEASSETPLSLPEWGNAAGNFIDEVLNRDGHVALLLRNLTFITTPKEFSLFWKSCCDSSAYMEPSTYESFGVDRYQEDGVDFVTPVPPQNVFSCHNEMSYNPVPPTKVALFCLQDALEGGESLLAPNKYLTKKISKEIKEFTKKHQGVLYTRKYHDAEKPATSHQKGSFMSWQDKCKTGSNGKAAVVSYFLGLGFTEKDIKFDSDDNLTVTFLHPGFIIGDDGEEQWFNIVDSGMCTAGDGTPYPKDLFDGVNSDKWEATSAFKLKPGDWLICDNRNVQHGRLPFNEHGGPPRKLLVVYTK